MVKGCLSGLTSLIYAVLENHVLQLEFCVCLRSGSLVLQSASFCLSGSLTSFCKIVVFWEFRLWFSCVIGVSRFWDCFRVSGSRFRLPLHGPVKDTEEAQVDSNASSLAGPTANLGAIL